MSRFVASAERAALAELAETWATIALDERAESDVEMLATGALSPLKGFMIAKDYLRVVREMRLENGLPWPLPITLAVSAAEAEALPPGSRAALRARDGRVVAVLDVADRWSPDKELEAREVHGTTDGDHPGVARLKTSGPIYVGGEVHVLARPSSPAFPAYHRDPRETRALFAERGWSKVVVFDAQGPMHRGHEHITKAALELCDGLLLHTPAGTARSDEVSAEVRVRCHEALLEHYYPEGRALLSVHPASPRHAGARETIFDAITRKNYGASHCIVAPSDAKEGGRHAVSDAEALWGAYGPGELGIQPLFFERAFYSTVVSATATEKTAPGDASTRVDLSDARVRELLAKGELPPAEVTRPEVARILVASASSSSRPRR